MTDTINPALIKILACPETKQPLKLADAEFVSKLNEQIKAGTAKNQSGVTLESEIAGALIREDDKRAYIIRENIPVMLIEESIELR